MLIRWTIGLLLIVFGLSALFEINIFRFIFPVILIALGWIIISKEKDPSKLLSTNANVDMDTLNETYIFSGTKKKIKSENFAGGKILTVFGGLELDLTEVKTKEKTIHLEINSVLGGMKIRIPKNWEIESVGLTAVLGGFENATDSHAKKEVKLIVSGSAVLGGVEISS